MPSLMPEKHKPIASQTYCRNLKNRKPQSNNSGWRTIGGKRIYFRSKWEINYAHFLEHLKSTGAILDWKYEPKTFWFDGIRRGVTSYKPDFLTIEADGTECYREVKGFMDSKSATKLKRMKKYHPFVRVHLVTKDEYHSLEKGLRHFLSGWED